MPFPRRLLNEGEQIALDLRPHWLFFGRQLAAGVLVAALLVGAFLVPSDWEFAAPAARILAAAITLVWAVALAIRLIVWLAGFVLFHAAEALIPSPGTSLR